MIRTCSLTPTDQNRANAAADLMSVAEFEAHLVRKFGAEYLEPINYAWQGGEFLPCTAVTSRPQQERAVGSSLPGPSELTTVG